MPMAKLRKVYDWFINNHIGKMPTPAEFIFRSKEITREELKERKQKQLAESREETREGIPMPPKVKKAMDALNKKWSLNLGNS